MKDTDLKPLGLTRIEAPSYRDALRKIDERFGREVSVVHTRVIRRKGLMGLFGMTGVEVYVTGREQYKAWRGQGPRSDRQPPRAPEGWQDRPVPAPSGETQPPRPRPPAEAVPTSPEPKRDRAGDDVARAIQGLEQQVRYLLHESGSSDVPAPHPLIATAAELLEQRGFSVESKRELLQSLAHRQLPGTSQEPEELQTLAKIRLSELIRPKLPPCQPIHIDAAQPGSGMPRVVVLVGPTGVGKTTTIAKLASPLHLLEKRSVGLITLDTYRIGAVDQLGRYAEIAGMPIEVVPAGGSARGAVEALKHCDIVFVDTAGRSQKDLSRLQEVRDMLGGLGELQVHLCLSMTASRANLLDVAEKFRVVEYNRVLLTKIDEAPQGGNIYDLLRIVRTPVSYVTCGQEVPDDIQVATEDRLLQEITGG